MQVSQTSVQLKWVVAGFVVAGFFVAGVVVAGVVVVGVVVLLAQAYPKPLLAKLIG